MDTLNEIRIQLTDFGRQCLRQDHNPDLFALINKTAKDIFTLCNVPATPERWRPKQGENYWMIQQDGEVEHHQYADDPSEQKQWRFGNCFPTRQAAEHARAGIQAYLTQFHTQATSA